MSTEESTSDAEWYWSKKGSGERNGPVSRERLEELAEQGDLESEDLIWTKGMDEWEEATSIEGLINPLPDDPNDKKRGKQSTQPKSEPFDDSRTTKSEAVSCIHNYDENDVCQKCGWSKRELIVIGEDPEREEENITSSSLAKGGSRQDASGSDEGDSHNIESHTIYEPSEVTKKTQFSYAVLPNGFSGCLVWLLGLGFVGAIGEGQEASKAFGQIVIILFIAISAKGFYWDYPKEKNVLERLKEDSMPYDFKWGGTYEPRGRLKVEKNNIKFEEKEIKAKDIEEVDMSEIGDNLEIMIKTGYGGENIKFNKRISKFADAVKYALGEMANSNS